MRVNVKIISRNINSLSENSKSVKRSFRTSIFSFLLMRLYGKCDHIVNQCKGMETDLLSVLPKLKNKTSVIYNPVNKTIENYVRNVDFTKIEKQNYLLCVGRLEKQKAFHFAIEAFAGVAYKYPSLRLKIIGQGSLEDSLKNLAISLNVYERIDFEGFQGNVIPFYLHANATILTSLYEGFPNVLIESITLGTPVVAVNCKSGPSEIIKNGYNGFIADYKSSTSLIEKIDLLLQVDMKPYDVHMTSKVYSTNCIIKKWLEI